MFNFRSQSGTTGQKVADLAKKAASLWKGPQDWETDNNLTKFFEKLASLMCWDAAIHVAKTAKGIRCPDLGNQSGYPVGMDNKNFAVLFGSSPAKVTNADDMKSLPPGCFVGFLENNQDGSDYLLHVMLHTDRGMGAGTKNDCIFHGARSVGWEELDMTRIFRNERVSLKVKKEVIYAEVEGQYIGKKKGCVVM